MNREITDKNLYLLLPSKVSLFVQMPFDNFITPILTRR